MHPTQFPALGGFRPVFEHRFLFWKFDFNGMLNYPFYDRIVRTPYFSFPVFLLLPLVLASSLGIIIFSLIFTGAAAMFKKQRQVFIFLTLWLIPIYLLLSVMENWSNLKTTFLLMALSPLLIFSAAGLNNLLTYQKLKKKMITLILLCIAIFCAVKIISSQEFSVDMRWYERFPRALEGKNISYIGDDLLTKKEDPQELLAQKKRLTRGNFSPELYSGRIDFKDTLQAMKREWGQKNITVVDIWKYVYEK
jgi:glucan phosphoethanolaminetransferase (alkaline phosphatase superfamily)